MTNSTPNLPRLAIVSTYDALCGIAGYTRHLEKYLSAEFNIEVFDLDPDFMRGTTPATRRLANRQIQDICSRLKDFDHVNIQLEYGTLGSKQEDILVRLKRLIEAAPSVSVTFHTILPPVHPPYSFLPYLLIRLRFAEAYERISNYRRDHGFREQVYALLRKAQMVKPTVAIVHTHHDARALKQEQRINNVLHHPLSFLPSDEAKRIRESSSRQSFPGLSQLPDNVKLLGVFGFLSHYKGIADAIKALQCLPEEYHLAIFGGLHPVEIKDSGNLNPYVDELIGLTHVGKTEITSLGTNQNDDEFRLTLNVELSGSLAMIDTPRNISHRVHFLGPQSDEDLARGMAVCDATLLPYYERGQASSGPISVALDMGARIIASRTKTFIRLARYHPHRIEFFDVGNFLELAQGIKSIDHQVTFPTPAFNTQSNTDIYKHAANAQLNSSQTRK